MNKLTVNHETGFLESSNSFRAFDAPKKARFLELAGEYFDQTGKMPNVRALCDSVGIAMTTFERHYQQDERFRDGIREFKLKGKDILEDKMFEYAQNKGGYMHMITWLRKEFPEEYNPEAKLRIQSDVNVEWLKRLAESIDTEEYKIENKIRDEQNRRGYIIPGTSMSGVEGGRFISCSEAEQINIEHRATEEQVRQDLGLPPKAPPSLLPGAEA
jgi:hypothetical protein